jgi:hypothetical protein
VLKVTEGAKHWMMNEHDTRLEPVKWGAKLTGRDNRLIALPTDALTSFVWFCGRYNFIASQKTGLRCVENNKDTFSTRLPERWMVILHSSAGCRWRVRKRVFRSEFEHSVDVARR